MKSIKIDEGLFFKEDFLKLPDDVIIFIKSGKLMMPKKEKK